MLACHPPFVLFFAREQMGSMLGGFLGTVSSTLGLQDSVPYPRQHQRLVVFVIGGITWEEVSRLHEYHENYIRESGELDRGLMVCALDFIAIVCRVDIIGSSAYWKARI